MATHLSYTHANLGHVTVAEIVKHSRPVLVVDIKRTHGSVKQALRLRFYINGAINKTYTYRYNVKGNNFIPQTFFPHI